MSNNNFNNNSNSNNVINAAHRFTAAKVSTPTLTEVPTYIEYTFEELQAILEFSKVTLTFTDEGPNNFVRFFETKSFKLEVRQTEVLEEDHTTYYTVVNVETTDNKWFEQYMGLEAETLVSLLESKV